MGVRTLKLTLTRRWFDMVASGEKREEYRRPSRWILSRLEGKSYDAVEFRNGYGRDAPAVVVAYRGWRMGTGRAEWGCDGERKVVIELGGVLSWGV